MINFFKFYKLYLFISLSVIFAGVVSIFRWGFNYSIDFVGGTDLSYKISSEKVSLADIENVVNNPDFQIKNIFVTEDSVLNIKASPINEKQEIVLRQALEEKLSGQVEVLKFETVGPTIGSETLRKTIYAVLLAILGILAYIAYAFKNINYAISAVIALFHDIIVVVGVYSIISYFWGAELDLLFVTALLTTLAFSVHDTIVVFDQMREYKKNPKYSNDTIEVRADRAVTSTIVRSLNNSLTIAFMLLALVLLGGETIRFFATTLLVGTITGTYSSPFVSVPIAVFLEKRKK